MEKKKLLQTKRKLTIVFSLLVFSVAVFLQLSFFSIKYVSFHQAEKESMFVLSERLRQISIPIYKIPYFFRPGKSFSNPGKINEAYEDRIEDGKFMNFIVLNARNEVVSQDIKNDIDLGAIKYVFETGTRQIVIHSGMVISIIDYKNENKLIIFKKVRYSFADYLQDISYFTLIIFLFSVLFYYIGFWFVSRNLKPVEESLLDMHDFIHNAGHELKTPISIIDLNLQLMKQSGKFESELIQEGLLETKRLNHLIESLLELSNINRSYSSQKLDIGSEVQAIIKEFKGESDRKNIGVVFEEEYKKFFTMNRQYFYILFSNILGNAIKYTQDGGNIHVTLSKNRLIVQDNGIGIKKEDQDKIWNRFYQSDNSRGESGFGIGLALVQKISNIYKLKLSLESDEGKGSQFIIEF